MGAPASEYTLARTELVRAQTLQAELKNAQLRGELVPAVEIQKAVAAERAECAKLLRAVRARLLAVPGRVLQRSPHLNRADRELIEEEIRVALSELAAAAEDSTIRVD